MTEMQGGQPARHVRLADLPRAVIGDHIWHPLRRALDVTGFGVGVYSAERSGEMLVGPHTETGSSSNRHEEVYVVLAGRAQFQVDGETFELGPEEFLAVAPEAKRGATASADGTSVLVVGGAVGTVEPAPYEHWYTALTATDPADAAAIAAEGLREFPRHGQLNYQLACFSALAGSLEVAARHLRQAVASEERAWEWLTDDDDLDALRDLPGAIPTRAVAGSLHVEQAGSGADVLLLHAGVADARMWDPQWVAWPDGRRVTRLDLRGFGRSPLPASSFSHAGDVLAVLDQLEIERAALVGASFGGRVALDLAASHPERVTGLVLAGAGLPDHDWSTGLEAFGAAEDEALAAGDLDRATEVNVGFWVPDAPDWVREAIREQQRTAFELQVGSTAEDVLLTDDLTTRLEEIDIPALVLVGEQDYGDFHALADRLAGALPRARRATIAGAGHLPSLERADAFDAVVLPFLDELEEKR